MKTRALLFVALLLGACATDGAGSGESVGAPRTTWRCDGGAAFSVRFSPTAARVFAGGQTYDLPQVEAASGARYANGSVQYWEHDGVASLAGAAGGPYAGCHQAPR